MKNHKAILGAAFAIIFSCALAFGLLRLDGLEVFHILRDSKISMTWLTEGWQCTDLKTGAAFQAELPDVLPLPPQTEAIALTNTLPEAITGGDAFRMQTLNGWYRVYIDGVLRTAFGDPDAVENYWYKNASAMLFIELTDEDAGKPIRIETGCIMPERLAMQRAPVIAAHHDLLLEDMLESTYGNLVILAMVISIFWMLLLWIFFRLKGQNIRILLQSTGFLILLTLYYNVGNSFIIDISRYAVAYFVFNDFIYYCMLCFIPIAGYWILLASQEEALGKWLKRFIWLHSLLALAFYALHMLGYLEFESVDMFLGVLTTIGYIWAFAVLKPYRLAEAEQWFLLPVFISLFAYLLDYFKYAGNLSFLPKAIENYLQVQSPFMLFLPLALVVYIFFVLMGIVQIISNRQTKLALEAQNAEFRAALAENEFHASLDSMNQIRKMRHDLEHHFSVINAYLANGDDQAAQDYMASVSAMMPKRALSGKNLITGSFIEQYRSLCEQNEIQFAETISYDEDVISDKVALGIILGNGLKNAFESAATAEGALRFMRISGKQVHDNLILVIENGFGHPIHSDLTSTKAKERGFGLANMQDAVERCGGYLEYHYTDTIFKLEVVLSIT